MNSEQEIMKPKVQGIEIQPKGKENEQLNLRVRLILQSFNDKNPDPGKKSGK